MASDAPEAQKHVTPKKTGGKAHDHIPIILGLLAVFGLAVLCVGIGLSWLAGPSG